MQGATVHIRLFGLIYNNPKQGDISCGIDVRIHIVPAIRALERLAVSNTNVMAKAASLRSICRFYNNQLNTRKSAFVSKESSELTEVPTIEFAAESLVPSLCCLTNLTEVLNSKSDTSLFGIVDNLFGNGVIDDCCGGLFSPTKPFQEFLATSCAFGLNRTTDFKSSFTILIQSIGRISLAFGCANNIRYTEIKTDNSVRNLFFGFGDVYSLIEEELAFLVNKIGFPFDVRYIFFVVTSKRNLLTLANCPNGGFVSFVGQDSGIVTDASVRSEFALRLVVKFVCVGNLADASDNHLSGEIEFPTYIVITKMMYFELTESFVRPSSIGNVGTRIVGFFHGLEKKQPLLISRENLYFQNQFHVTNVLKVFWKIVLFNIKKWNAAQFRPLS